MPPHRKQIVGSVRGSLGVTPVLTPWPPRFAAGAAVAGKTSDASRARRPGKVSVFRSSGFRRGFLDDVFSPALPCRRMAGPGHRRRPGRGQAAVRGPERRCACAASPARPTALRSRRPLSNARRPHGCGSSARPAPSSRRFSRRCIFSRALQVPPVIMNTSPGVDVPPPRVRRKWRTGSERPGRGLDAVVGLLRGRGKSGRGQRLYRKARRPRFAKLDDPGCTIRRSGDRI